MSVTLKILLSVLLMFTISCKKIENSDYREIVYTPYTDGAFTFIPLGQDLTNANSAWGSIGITESGLIYVVVCDHITDAAVYEYNTNNDKLFTLGLLSKHLNFRYHFQRQPKVHTPLYQYEKDGLVYFGTDAGDWSEGALHGHFDEGYAGGYLACISPCSKRVIDLGLVNRFGGTKCMVLDNDNGLMYYAGSPTCNFFKYDINSRELTDLGRANGYKVTRTLFFDKWNNCYNTNETGNLVRYNLAKDTVEILDDYLPGRSTTGPSQVAYGPNRDYIIGVDGYGGQVYKYTPSQDGNGKMDSLGVSFLRKGMRVRSLNMANNKLYMMQTTLEEISAGQRYGEFVIYDLEQKKITKSFRLDQRVQQAYGHPIMDDKGNMYVAAFWDASDYDLPPKIKHRCFLVKFNPDNL